MKIKLIEKKEEVPGVETFIFEPEVSLTWKPGQFYHLVLHHEPTDDRGSDRWFSNAAAPYENVIQITTRLSQDKSSTFKKALKEMKIGDEIEISDLDGDFVIDDLNKKYVFIAGGIGITPFRSILKQLQYEKKSIDAVLLYANRDQNVVFKEELEEVAKNTTDFKIQYVFSPEMINEEKIKELVPDIIESVFYVSGPEPMVESMGKVLKGLGVSDENLKQDWFPGYTE